MAGPTDRPAVVDALLSCVTQQEARAALRLAGRWLREHPDDLDLRGITESAVLVLTAWDLDLEDWPQRDRDALLEATGRAPTKARGPTSHKFPHPGLVCDVEGCPGRWRFDPTVLP